MPSGQETEWAYSTPPDPDGGTTDERQCSTLITSDKLTESAERCQQQSTCSLTTSQSCVLKELASASRTKNKHNKVFGLGPKSLAVLSC